jgi:hypothetical protein
MSVRNKRNVLIIPDNESEQFTQSSCECTECKSIHFSIEEWDTFESSTAVQRGMKRIVSKIEKDIKERKEKKEMDLDDE